MEPERSEVKRIASLNTSGINHSNEYLSPAVQEASEQIQQLATVGFQAKLASFPLDQLYETVKGSSPSEWVAQVAPPEEFLNMSIGYLRASGKWEDGALPVGEEIEMKHLMEAFCDQGVTFEQLMSHKSSSMSDGRIFSIADRIADRYTILYNPDARSTSDDFVGKWFASVNKEDRGFLSNISKYLIPGEETPSRLRELGNNASPEQLRMAFTMTFYTLFIADSVYSSYDGPMPELNRQALKDSKVQAVRKILDLEQRDVLFIQEPMEGLADALTPPRDAILPPPRRSRLDSIRRWFSVHTLADATDDGDKYKLFEGSKHASAVILRSAAFDNCQFELVDCAPYLQASTVFNGCTAVLVNHETHRYVLLSVHAKSQTTTDHVMETLTKLMRGLTADYSLAFGVIGIDANTDLQGRTKGAPTSVKVRSFLQFQLAKALKEERARKDFILTYRDGEFTIQQGDNLKVEAVAAAGFHTITTDIDSHIFLPTMTHPFDHYLISAAVTMP